MLNLEQNFLILREKNKDCFLTTFSRGKFFAIQTAWGVKLDDEGGIIGKKKGQIVSFKAADFKILNVKF
jgi:hypothetical protein